MGNYYVKPAREGDSPHTRSGVPPPKLNLASKDPIHRHSEPMSLEMHMRDERARAAGLTPAEREWRAKWLSDQKLHPDEPIAVDAVYRQLNPVRRIYRYPLDKLYKHWLEPTFGVYYGSAIRVMAPKLLMGLLAVQTIYYMWKYEVKDWQKNRGVDVYAEKRFWNRAKELEEKYPGLLERITAAPDKTEFFSKNWQLRRAYVDFGETQRPW